MKIGFIAMSGVRVQNRALMEAGLTLPGFVERSKVIASLPSLSLLTLAALTPSRHQVEYREIQELRTAGELPGDYDLVALTSLSAQVKEAYAVADAYRARGVPVVMGGLHVTAQPEEALQHCTSVVVGEGEPVWEGLVADAERGALRPRYGAGGRGGFDLRSAPVPRYELLDPARYNRITVQTSRGCPHRCEFCASSVLLTPRYVVKPAAKVLEEIAAIRRIWDRPFIEFADDNSFVDRGQTRELLRALAREPVRWFTETDLGIAEDPELLGLMRDSGCQQILVGLESPRRSSLGGLELKTDWKARRWDRYREAIAAVQDRGITVNGCFILGLDGDTPEIFDEVFEFVRSSGLYEVQITVQTPFPGTPLDRRLREEGRLTHDGEWERCTLFDVNFEPRGMSARVLEDGLRNLAIRLYSAEETRARRRRFWRRRRSRAEAVGVAVPSPSAQEDRKKGVTGAGSGGGAVGREALPSRAGTC